jgi:hypothetical protein
MRAAASATAHTFLREKKRLGQEKGSTWSEGVIKGPDKVQSIRCPVCSVYELPANCELHYFCPWSLPLPLLPFPAPLD